MPPLVQGRRNDGEETTEEATVLRQEAVDVFKEFSAGNGL